MPSADAPGAGSRRRRAPCAGRSGPASGRTAPPSHFGPPTAPSSTRVAARQAASVSGGSGSPVASIAAPPNGVLLDLDVERQRLEHAHRLADHLGPDAVAGQAGDR